VPAAVDSTNPAVKLATALPVRVWTRWGPRAAVVGLSLVGGELVLHLGHGLGHAAFNLTLTGAAVLWLRTRNRSVPSGLPPTSVSGWLSRCQGLIEQFEALEASPAEVTSALPQSPDRQRRQQCLDTLRAALSEPPLQVAVAGTVLPPSPCQGSLVAALSTRQHLRLHWGEPLGSGAAGWDWPPGLAGCDLLIYSLNLPLSAADLRWLEARPTGLEAWVLAQVPAATLDRDRQRHELAQQLQQIPQERLLLWSGCGEELAACLEPLNQTLQRDGISLRQSARLRQAQTQHQHWLIELEQLRRQRLRHLVGKTQWLVAAGVLAAPAASLDLLVLTAANGLMLKEMAKLWNCRWELQQLQAAACELGQAALTLGVVEWSNQALAHLLRLHGASWLVGGALQALSAAYLTRVVARAMADTLALSAGLSEPNLALIKAQAPQLVLQAAEAEKIDWANFIKQGRQWLSQQQASSQAIAASGA